MNTLSIPIGIVLSVFTGELENAINGKDANGDAFHFEAGSYCFGVLVFLWCWDGFFTMLIRDALSATSCAVVATCNKFLAEIVNFFIWKPCLLRRGGGVLVL